jgi:TPP-dependent indolepyruvate ferredoxin oxidoreductase alpha subunit
MHVYELLLTAPSMVEKIGFLISDSPCTAYAAGRLAPRHLRQDQDLETFSRKSKCTSCSICYRKLVQS